MATPSVHGRIPSERVMVAAGVFDTIVLLTGPIEPPRLQAYLASATRASTSATSETLAELESFDAADARPAPA